LTYTVLLSRQAEKFYKKLNKKLKERVKETLIALQNQPHLVKALHGDLKGNNSIRIGKIRIIYTISEKDKTIYTIAIGPRKKIYQQ
jgi:mRNA-degrading endonuclease RelE of RelBE toxin-antitoxin system